MTDLPTLAEHGEPLPRAERERFDVRVMRAARRAPVHAALLVIAVIWLVPTLGLLITSFRPLSEIFSSGWWTAIIHWKFTLQNYGQVFDTYGMLSAFKNSMLITIPATLAPMTIGALAAYAFAWLEFPFRDTLFLCVVTLMVVPIQAELVPQLKLFGTLGLTDTIPSLWLAHTAFGTPFAVFLLRNFFIQLPRDLIDAARMDGASHMSIFRRVVVPLSVPALAAYGIFQFLWVWNDLLMALVFVPGHQPMTVAVVGLQGMYGSRWDLLSASSFVLMGVPLIVFFALQRYFVQGILAGAVKS